MKIIIVLIAVLLIFFLIFNFKKNKNKNNQTTTSLEKEDTLLQKSNKQIYDEKLKQLEIRKKKNEISESDFKKLKNELFLKYIGD